MRLKSVYKRDARDQRVIWLKQYCFNSSLLALIRRGGHKLVYVPANGIYNGFGNSIVILSDTVPACEKHVKGMNGSLSYAKGVIFLYVSQNLNGDCLNRNAGLPAMCNAAR